MRGHVTRCLSTAGLAQCRFLSRASKAPAYSCRFTSEVNGVCVFVCVEKCKRFLQEFYTEDDSGKKVFKYGAQLVRTLVIFCYC